MNKKELENEIETHLKNYYIIKREFDIYKYIKQNAEIYNKETNQIAYFLKPVLYSLLNSTLLGICKMLDQREQKNIYELLNRFKNNIDNIITTKNSEKEKDNILETINSKIDELDLKQNTIGNLKTYRDKIIAHADKKFFDNPDKIFIDFNTKYEELETMLNMIENILNELLYMVCDTKYVFLEEYKDDYQYLLECIKEHNEKAKK